MKPSSVLVILLAGAALTTPYCQVLVNGGFETGSLPPWYSNGWVVDTVCPLESTYCAWDTGGHWIRQDFESVRAQYVSVEFWARQPEQPSGMVVDLLYDDSTVQPVPVSPADTWTCQLIDSLLNCRKRLCGLRFWGCTGSDSTYLDDVRLLQRDIGVTQILSPTGDSFRVGQRITPAAKLRNLGTGYGRCWVWAHSVHESLPDEYWDSAYVTLPPGAESIVEFRTWIPRFAGWYRFFIATDPLCSTYLRLLVLDSSGVAESRGPEPTRLSAGPTIGSSFLPGLAACRSHVTVRDASGATVWQGPAADRVALSPGVYFIEAEGRRARVILVR